VGILPIFLAINILKMPSHLKQKALFGIRGPGYYRERSPPTIPTQNIREPQNQERVGLDMRQRDSLSEVVNTAYNNKFEELLNTLPFMDFPSSDNNILENATPEEDLDIILLDTSKF
jgi:hypothetical protein